MDGLHNYLLTQGLYEEIGGYREKTYPVKNLVHNAARLQAFGLPADSTLEWNHTYGNIADGSARRADLVQGSHLGVMIATATNQSAIDWFAQTLGQPQEAQGLTYWYKESSGLVALIAAVLSTLCLAALLLDTPYFAAARQPLNNDNRLERGQWRLFALINVLLTLLLYPLFTRWGGANEPIAALLPAMPLEMGNGIITWLLVSAAVSIALFSLWYRRKGVPLQYLGVFAPPTRDSAVVIRRSLLLALLLMGYLYALTLFIHNLFAQELRFLWPLLKPMTAERWQLYPLYWLLILIAFTAVNGLILTVQLKQPIGYSFTGNLLRWSVGSILAAVGGLFLLWCLHFIPAYLQIGPGFDVIGLPQYGGRWMMMLPVIMAQYSAMLIINHWCYLKTGYIWLGVTLTSLLMAWMMVGGQVIGRFMA